MSKEIWQWRRVVFIEGKQGLGLKEGENRFVEEGGAKLGKNDKNSAACWSAVFGFLPRVAGG